MSLLPSTLSTPYKNCSCKIFRCAPEEAVDQRQPSNLPALDCDCYKLTSGHLHPGVPWYANGKEWRSSAKFPHFFTNAYFNYSKCENIIELLVFE